MSTTINKRSSDSDGSAGSAEKRQKTEEKKQDKPIYDSGIVFLKRNDGAIVTHVPVVNFKTYASSVVPYLETQIVEEISIKIYTHVSRRYRTTTNIQQWAHWLIHRDIVAALGGEEQILRSISHAHCDAVILGDIDYQDASVDAFVVLSRVKNDPARLDVPRFRALASCPWKIYYKEMIAALILHHDVRAVSTGQYTERISETVRELALKHFSAPDEFPKDPLSLSPDDFCKQYHQHHERNLPCYKSRKLSSASDKPSDHSEITA